MNQSECVMRILIVDDSEDSRDITEAALLSGGYDDIRQAESGWHAFQMLRVGDPSSNAPAEADVILLDIMMPEIDGIETCARLRNDRRYVDVPIIMVTSLDDMESLANAFLAGATDYVTKPVNRIELIARVRAAVRLKSELDRRQIRERELLNYLANWGDRQSTGWIDPATGLFLGHGAEAYFIALAEREPQGLMSVLALAVDRLEALRLIQGEAACRRLLGHVAQAVRAEAATVGVVAGAYPNGVILIIAPQSDGATARELAEALRRTVRRLALANRESTDSDYVTASVSVATGRVANGLDRVNLITQAIAHAQRAAADGGDRVVAVPI